MGMLARHGRDKLTLLTDPPIASFGDWVEQLSREHGQRRNGNATGRGRNIRPIGLLRRGSVLVSLNVEGEKRRGGPSDLRALEEAGHPVMILRLRDIYDIGGQFFLWEFATAVAGYLLGINPFDQPNVESAKKRATAMVNAYHQSGQLPEWESAPVTPMALAGFLEQGQVGDYVAIQAFVQPTEDTSAALATLRDAIGGRCGLATTMNYGPRYLHSTGQLHKGDAGNGLFVILTHDPAPDVPIPDEPGEPTSSISFGVLELAQALGDKQALEDAGRRVIHFHLGGDVVGGLQRLTEGLAS
jgi:hypothetical protein